MQFMYKVLDTPPIDAYVRVLEVGFQVAAGAFRFLDTAFLGIDLHRHVGIAAAPAASLLAHEAAEQYPKVPIVHTKSQEQKSCIGQGPSHHARNQILIPRHADQVIKVIILGQDDRIGLFEVTKKMVDEGALRAGTVVRLVVVDGG